jgi:hypothetical protein
MAACMALAAGLYRSNRRSSESTAAISAVLKAALCGLGQLAYWRKSVGVAEESAASANQYQTSACIYSINGVVMANV